MVTMRGRAGRDRGDRVPANIGSKAMGLGYFAAWAVLIVSLLITFAAWHLARKEIERTAHSRFDARIAEIEAVITGRLLDYRQVLRGAAGLFAASKSIERDQWRAYVQSLSIEQGYPGLHGIGFSQRISAAEKNAHIRQVRAEGFPAYDIWPAGERAEYTSIVYLEPFAGRNLRAFGYDMFSEPARRSAMELARDSGIATASAKVALVQETNEAPQAGFLMYLPVYRSGAPTDTVQARRAALQGYLYSSFRMNDLMRGVLAEQAADLDLEIYDGVHIGADTLMYRRVLSKNAVDQALTPAFTRTLRVDVFGHTWSMRFASLAAFDAATENLRLRAIADNMPVLIAYVDADQRYRFNNQTYQSWFEIAPPEIFGRHIRDVVGDDNYQSARPHIEAALAGEKVNFETVLVAGGARLALFDACPAARA